MHERERLELFAVDEVVASFLQESFDVAPEPPMAKTNRRERQAQDRRIETGPPTRSLRIHLRRQGDEFRSHRDLIERTTDHRQLFRRARGDQGWSNSLTREC